MMRKFNPRNMDAEDWIDVLLTGVVGLVILCIFFIVGGVAALAFKIGLGTSAMIVTATTVAVVVCYGLGHLWLYVVYPYLEEALS